MVWMNSIEFFMWCGLLGGHLGEFIPGDNRLYTRCHENLKSHQRAGYLQKYVMVQIQCFAALFVSLRATQHPQGLYMKYAKGSFHLKSTNGWGITVTEFNDTCQSHCVTPYEAMHKHWASLTSPFHSIINFQDVYTKEKCHTCYFHKVNMAVTLEPLISFTLFYPEIVNVWEYF
jgi:hypothetical protein